MKTKFCVVEDNGGGLHLYIFQDEQCIYAHHDYGITGQLTRDIEAWKSGSDPRTWDGCEDDPHERWGDVVRSADERIVADSDRLYPERMGNAALKEFGVVDDDDDND